MSRFSSDLGPRLPHSFSGKATEIRTSLARTALVHACN